METVLLADMNSFFASVEQALNADLQGKPIIVCGDPEKRHGIVLAASKEAKRYGVKTTMGSWEAISLCPDAIFVKPQMAKYVEMSVLISEIAMQFSPLVEPFSIDELFIDTIGTEKLFGSSVDVAYQLRNRIKTELGITCSIGVAPNKLLAKICCSIDAKKNNDGIAKWSMDDLPNKFWSRPIRELFGIGSRMERNFRNMGITTIGALANYPLELLQKKFGIMGEVYHLSANGIDNSPVTPHSHDTVKGIGHSITLPKDYYCWEEIKVVLREITEEVCSRARRKGKAGKTISLYVRGIDLITSVQRSKSLNDYSNLSSEVYPVVEHLYKIHWDDMPVRAISVSISNLIDDTFLQLDVFNDRIAERSLAYTIDNIKYRYGKTAIFKASSLDEGGLYHERSKLIGGHQK